ncbi:serine hydrolase domain-containing protein [Paradesertivirga mongoliensis]|uniref:Serine hydrolase domain-containing protein n=1 Tax=Paradesertivirga mongoliensis TaxID=2100740 RepID=A0ABW4ZJ66_9SPHI|nr:serine hydrolase domain-containing protein [Pedobacter mongoliensis]
MIRHFFIIIQALAFLFFITSCSSKETKKTVRTAEDNKADSLAMLYDPEKADKRIDAFMKNLHRNRNFNGNVLVAKQGKILYQNAFGWADYLRRDSLQIDYQFELASVSKPLTATAVLMLVDQGKIRLEQTVKDFYPDFPYEGITIKMLLTHRSGLMNYVYFVDGIWRKEKRNQKIGITNQDVMRIIAERKPNPYTTPNRKFHYNNSNYMILAAIVEKVSGMKFSQFMKENIFDPSGMKNTAVYSKAEYEKIPVKVVGHDRGTWRYSVVQNFLDGPVGDKGIYSTVRDLYLFDRALRKGKLVSKALLDSAYTGHNETVKGHFNYGYGWRIFNGDKHHVVYHTGWWHGFRHIYLRDLTTDVTIVLLTNLTNGSLQQLHELFRIVDMPVVHKSAYSGSGDTADD